MPFHETSDGQTHSFNDGCGEPAHNGVMDELKKNEGKSLYAIIEKTLWKYNELSIPADVETIASDIESAILKRMDELIVDEILICRHENTPTSRLTSLMMKIKRL